MPTKLKPKLATIGTEGEEGKDFTLKLERSLGPRDTAFYLTVYRGDGRQIEGGKMLVIGDGGVFTRLINFDPRGVTPFRKATVGGTVEFRGLKRRK